MLVLPRSDMLVGLSVSTLFFAVFFPKRAVLTALSSFLVEGPKKGICYFGFGPLGYVHSCFPKSVSPHDRGPDPSMIIAPVFPPPSLLLGRTGFFKSVFPLPRFLRAFNLVLSFPSLPPRRRVAQEVIPFPLPLSFPSPPPQSSLMSKSLPARSAHPPLVVLLFAPD